MQGVAAEPRVKVTYLVYGAPKECRFCGALHEEGVELHVKKGRIRVCRTCALELRTCLHLLLWKAQE